jgi:uncharacterized protein YjbJ (UPF0337 family)
MSALDKARNKLQELTGRAREELGGAVGNESMQAQGQRDRIAGNLKGAGEKLKDAFRR